MTGDDVFFSAKLVRSKEYKFISSYGRRSINIKIKIDGEEDDRDIKWRLTNHTTTIILMSNIYY